MKLYSDKKILIAGAGAIGSFYGGLMANAGYDTELLARGAHLAQMQQSGLVIKSWKYGDINVNVKAVSHASGLYDIIFLCVKSQDTADMCAALKNHLKDDGCIVSFQNGVENPDIISSFFGAERTLGASLFVGLWIDPPGTVSHTASGDCEFGAWSGQSAKFEPVIRDILETSGVSVKISENIRRTLWNKLVWNVAYNPLSALLGSTCGPMIKSDLISPLIESMVAEVVEAAALHGVTITEEEWREKIAHRDSLEKYKTSMLQDIEKMRSPEADGILGPVIRTLEKAGRKAPYCETIFRTVEFKYGKKFIYCPKIAADVIVKSGDRLLLIERKNEPHGWAIPGGFIDYGEKTEDAARRELFEETGISAEKLNLLGVYSDPKRDKRGHTVSVVYYTESFQKPKAGDDAGDAVYFPFDKLPDNIVFDHRQIIGDYLLLNEYLKDF